MKRIAPHIVLSALVTLTLTLAPFAQAAQTNSRLQTAYFAEGCFWKTQAVFSEMPGVVATEVGYTGGRGQNPTYEEVCSHTTHHAEACKVVYDPSKISYEALVNKFFTSHDPTTVNRQGPDVGDQYRSAIFFANDEQKKIAEDTKARLGAEHKYSQPIATIIEPATKFWKAEDYHQYYFAKHGRICF